MKIGAFYVILCIFFLLALCIIFIYNYMIYNTGESIKRMCDQLQERQETVEATYDELIQYREDVRKLETKLLWMDSWISMSNKSKGD